MLYVTPFLFLGGCSLDSVDPPEQFVWEAIVQSPLEEGAPLFSGSVSMITGGGSTDVAVRLDGAIEGTTFGWRIRAGTCDGEGELVAPEGIFEDFVIDATGGGGMARFGIVGQVRPDLEYSAEIRRGEEEGGDLLVCSTMQSLN